MTGLHSERFEAATRARALESGNKTLREKLEISFLTPAKVETPPVKDLGEPHDELERNTGDYHAPVKNVGDLNKELVTLRDLASITDEKMKG